jgi:cytochrome bd-type quinol oxidase subunit 2
MTVRALAARWVMAMPPLLRIGLALATTAVGLSVSERSLYGQLGFPAEVGHTPVELLAHPVVVLLVGLALFAWMMARQQPQAEERRRAELLLHGALIALLAFGWVAALAQADSARAAFQRGSVRIDYPLVAPLSVRALPAEVEWRADVPTSARVAYGPALFVRWTGGTVWCWDVERRLAVGVPAVQIALVRTQGFGEELARPDLPTTSTTAPPP